MDQNCITIACQSDVNYLPHTAAMLDSLRSSNRTTEFELLLLHDNELPSDEKTVFEKFVTGLKIKINWLTVSQAMIDELPPGWDYIPKTCWYRVFLPELSKDQEKILFLDGDVLVLDDITDLWNTDLDDNLFAAVTNAIPEVYSHRPAALGLPGPEHYFNAGIALWNLKEMRRQNFTSLMLETSKQRAKEFIWLEQDAANVLFHDKRVHLHPRWNYQNGICFNSWGTRLFSTAELKEANCSPALVHFEGGKHAKPWHFFSRHPYRSLYFKHRKKTPWPKVKIEGRTPKNILKNYLPAKITHWLRRINKHIF